MSGNTPEFDTLVAAAKQGNAAALEQLVQQYEPDLRIVAKLRLGKALQPHLDTIDLVQSVHRSLLIGLRENRFDISTPERLIGLALTIVRRKVAKQWRHIRRQQRLSGGPQSTDDLINTLISLESDTDAAREVAMRDRLGHLMHELDPTEQRLVELRIDGYSTVEVAHQLHLDPDVLRVKLSRLRKRLREKGFENDWV